MQTVRPHTIFPALLMPLLAAGAATAAGLENTVAQCQTIEDRHARLACFDALPHPVKQSAPAGTTERVSAHSTAVDGSPKTSQITRISRTIDNRQIFHLDDGTVWQENRNGSRRFESGHAVSITQSQVLGSETIASYWMEVEGAKFKVVRLR
ncbi:hypothetical protein HNQ60_002348 [Povalibacter uvarum]|uniref:Uncharacterized protein n=1 Tax=Povalibacter uvarum TaxID=732238 RepID=A0A841HK95_9GAMM|nr:hypothetical protein [Povalibacter uvarum]MBB6093467.1 hypothetical protein [Povalibacter uvarum]